MRKFNWSNVKRKSILFIAIAMVITTFSGCSKKEDNTVQKNYEGRTFYEIFVRAFKDSDGDGIGDLKGVTSKLDYLQDLGIKGIWLMPINKATSYHGYDVEDYYSIDEDYGTMDDLKELLTEAHKRDIKVVMDLVINHTSEEHPWFKAAREDEKSPYRDYYIWTKDMDKINETSKMGTKGWSKNGDKDELYFSIFWSGMPDLNMDNSKVNEEIGNIAKYYLDLGIDGFRLDAAKWIYDEEEKNIKFWDQFNKYVKSLNKDAVLVGEVWDKPAVIKNYAKPLDSFFEFELGKTLATKLKNKNLSSFVEEYNNWSRLYSDVNPDFIMSNFLSNHDQARIMSVIYDEAKVKIAAAIYLTLPGTPYIYYGEELGTKGTKPDERLREPFIWSSTDESENTSWIDISNDKSKVALDVQESDVNSIYNLYKGIIKVKNERPSLRYGTVGRIDVGDKSVLVMERAYSKEKTLVIVNSSSNDVEINLDLKGNKVLYSNNEGRSDLSNNIKLKAGEITIVGK